MPTPRRKAVIVALLIVWTVLVAFGIVSQFDPQWLRDLARVGARVEAQVSFDAGDLSLRNGDYRSAIGHYRQALEIEPDYVEAYLNQAIAYARSGALPQGERVLREALDLDPPEKGKIHYNLADMCVQQEKWEEALVHYRQALRLNVNPAFVHQKIGNLHVQRKDFARAREAFEDCLAARADLSLYYRDMLHDNVVVFADNPSHLEIIEAQLGRELTEAELGRYDLASLRRVNLETPNVSRVHNLLGYVCSNLSDHDAAYGHFKRALEIDPLNGEARKNLRALHEYRESLGGEDGGAEAGD